MQRFVRAFGMIAPVTDPQPDFLGDFQPHGFETSDDRRHASHQHDNQQGQFYSVEGRNCRQRYHGAGTSAVGGVGVSVGVGDALGVMVGILSVAVGLGIAVTGNVGVPDGLGVAMTITV